MSFAFETGNVGNKFREAFETYDPTNGGRWVQALASGDIIQLDGNTVAASYLVVSKDPFTIGETRLTSTATWSMPFEAAVGLSLSQRTLGQEFSIEFVSTETPLADPQPLTLASISQATTTLSATTASAHGLKPGMRIGISGCSDSRFNYPSLVVATIPTPTTFTATAGPGGTIPSLTAGPVNNSGTVYFRSIMGLAPNGTSLIFENASATNGSIFVRSEAGDALPSGTLVGNHSLTLASSASLQAINAAFTYAFQPTSEFRLTQFVDGVQWSDVPVDSINAPTNRIKRTQVVPDILADYRIRVRAVNQPGLTVPVAHIQSVAKTGTTTATVVTQTPHGLTVGDVIATYGVRDQTNFANLTTATAVASIVDATTFTVVWGAAVTASSQAGVIYRVNGGNLPSALGVLAQVVQSATRTANVLTLVGSAAWSGVLIGDYVNAAALHDTSGVDLNIDGAYRVRDIQTTSLVLEPIIDPITNVSKSPTGNDISTTNCGGVVVKRTDLRISYVKAMNFTRQRVEFMPRPQGDLSSALGVNVQNTANVNISNTPTVNATTTPVAPTTDTYNSAASTNARVLKGSAGTLFAIAASNVSASPRYLKLFNKATAPVPGTDTPILTITLPAATEKVYELGAVGQRFATGIGYSITGAAADADTTAIVAGEVKACTTYI